MQQKDNAIGVQLWSVKNNLSSDFDGTLEAIAGKGFDYAEAAGYDPGGRTVLGVSPATLKQKTGAVGLDLVSLHAAVTADTIDVLLEDSASLGVKYIICAMYPDEERTIETYKEIAETYNKLGLIAQRAGVQLGYHNHNFEFAAINNVLPFDLLLENTDPALVVFELDLGWVVQAGHDPAAFIQKYPNRFPLWHLRDVDVNGESVNAGEGVVGFHTLFRKRKQSGLLYNIVETPSAAPNGVERVAACYDYFEKAHLHM
ncbi:MAG TPA: sugar phosphate isomerase/epimerase [Niabella sp.]